MPSAVVLSDTGSDDEDSRKPRKKKGHKIAISDSSDDDDEKAPKASRSKGKTCFQNSSMIIASTISRIFWPVIDAITIVLHFDVCRQ